ncbi:MAG: hypothetical protein RL681_269 [Candidatus Parcubacteria bacterium]|jgi:hypothetical protein
MNVIMHAFASRGERSQHHHEIMKTKYLAYAILPALALGFVGTSMASANGLFMSAATPEEVADRHQTMFEQQAGLLGMSVDEFKAAWAQGKTLREIATERGITDDALRAKMLELGKQKLKAQLQMLVDRGIITQAQADSRFAAMGSRAANGQAKGGMRGFGRHLQF